MANWKKVILENDNAALAEITASTGINITDLALGTAGSNGDAVVVVDDDGNVKKIAQGNIAGTDTTYTASGAGITMSFGTGASPGGQTTFSIVPSEINHDDLLNYADKEHINWTASQVTVGTNYVIHPDNYTDTQYAAGEGILISAADVNGNYTASTNPNQDHVTAVGTLTAGSIGVGFGAIQTVSTLTTGLGTFSSVTATSVTSPIITATGTLNANTINATEVNITGSLEVDGTLTYNASTFNEVIANTTTGSNQWGTIDTDNHYFTGSITASGGISASSFTGDGSGLTGISSGDVNNAILSNGAGISLSDYDGQIARTVAIDLVSGGGLDFSGGELQIADNGVTTARIGSEQVTTDKIANGAVTAGKLKNTLISGAGVATGLDDNSTFLVSVSPSNTLKHISMSQITSYVDSQISYAPDTVTGSVTSVGVVSPSSVSSLTLSVANANTTPVITLAGTIDINDDNWGSGQLSLGNGGTGATTAAGAAENILTTNLTALSIGDSNDTITIPGDLEVLGDVITVNTTNLEITDPFILIGSGSNSTEDVGIKFGEAAGVGNTLFWDGTYDANKGRFAVGKDIGTTDYEASAATDLTAAYHLAGVYNGDDPDAANATQLGNIKLATDGNVYIYA